ncbi:MAG: hypothetical protein ABI120_04505 [Gemmatimonadaceae bacterium]
MTRTSSTHSSENMTPKHSRVSLSRRWMAGAAVASLFVLSSCDSAKILEVVDPDILNPAQIETGAGAVPLRYGALRDFVVAFDGSGDAFAVVTGNLADELRASDTFDGRLLPNKRLMNDNLPEMTSTYVAMHKARSSINNAINVIKVIAPTPKFNIGELYMYRAYMEDFFGEMYCSGVPFSAVVDGAPVLGTPETTTQVFTRAAASFDSALANADTAKKILFGAAVGKARALLNLGQYAAAAAAVAGVPTTFKLNSDHCLGSGCNENGLYNAAMATSSRYNPANNEGINGLNFLPTVPDPRLPWIASTRPGFNTDWKNLPIGLKPLRAGNNVLADGIEARLIEAEARLQGKTQADRDAVFGILNNLRATGFPGTVIPNLTGAAPATDAAAVTQLFQERAYWMYLTGHRLGDLRRLIRQYGRDAETVFPTGEEAPPRSGPYGSDVNFPVPASEKNNPNFTGCIDRKA